MQTDPKMIKQFLKSLIPKRLWERLRVLKLRRIHARFIPYFVQQRFGDVELTLEITDPMAEAWYGCGGGKLSEIELLQTGQLKPGSLVFDLGAHQAVVALRLASVVGSSGRVIAIEANPYHAKIAERNRKLNKSENILVENLAVSAAPGVISFSRDWDGQAIGKGDANVRATTVDDLAVMHGWPQVLYIDVEGYECEVLAGAQEVLKRFPDLYIEVHAGCGLEGFNGSVHRLLSHFSTEIYRLIAVRPADNPNEHDFICEFDDSLEWLAKRFYLVALSRATSEVNLRAR